MQGNQKKSMLFGAFATAAIASAPTAQTSTTNAFSVLMAPPSKKAKVEVVDPIVIAVIYIRRLKWIDPSEPLFGCPYVGQAVRAHPTAEEVAVVRWKEENGQAVREEKAIGLIHCLDVHGTKCIIYNTAALRFTARSRFASVCLTRVLSFCETTKSGSDHVSSAPPRE